MRPVGALAQQRRDIEAVARVAVIVVIPDAAGCAVPHEQIAEGRPFRRRVQ